MARVRLVRRGPGTLTGRALRGLRVHRYSGVQQHARLLADGPRVVPGLDVHDVAGANGDLASVVEAHGYLAGQADAGVVSAAGLGTGDQLDVVRSAPARLEDIPAQSEVAEGDDVHVAVVLERTLVRASMFCVSGMVSLRSGEVSLRSWWRAARCS